MMDKQDAPGSLKKGSDYKARSMFSFNGDVSFNNATGVESTIWHRSWRMRRPKQHSRYDIQNYLEALVSRLNIHFTHQL